jgi:ATP-dependent RNA/DNA helicase IGHMBP2
MAILHLESLPPQITKGTLVRLLTQVGQLDKQRIGAIDIRGRAASIEVPNGWITRLVAALDGATLGNRHLRAWSNDGGADRAEHFDRLLRLLEIEADAEAERAARWLARMSAAEAEQAGNTLLNLIVQEEHTGLSGYVLVRLRKRSHRPLPWTRLDIGTPVLLTLIADDTRLRGVVSDRTTDAIEVALPQHLPDAPADAVYRVDLSNDEVARARLRFALQRAGGAHGDRLARLRQILLGEIEPSYREPAVSPPLDASLNASQIDAVAFALSAHDVALVHGPPGTGKTTTVVEIIRQAIRGGEKVLACAPSNLAVDNLFERLLAANENVVRIGHPARVLPQLREHTLDALVERHPDMRLARKLTREAEQMFDRANRYTRAKPAPGEKQELRGEAKRILADVRRIEAQVVQQVLDDATVVCATLIGLDSDLLGPRRFDLAVVDEACQTTEPACWLPLLRSERVILAGDHCQLPPTIVSKEAEVAGFGVSLFERLMESAGSRIARRLTVQYRMHEAIMNFSSARFYDSALLAHESVREHRLSDLPGITLCGNTAEPLTFIDTAGAGYDEELEPDGESRRNPGEARLIVRQAEALLAAGLTGSQLAIITPYAAQARLLREMLDADGLEIDTVDGFQGREKEAVLISLVRSNERGEIGFLADDRRMNVALTRARRRLIVVGDSATIGMHPFYQALLEYFESVGGYRTVWEEMRD